MRAQCSAAVKINTKCRQAVHCMRACKSASNHLPSQLDRAKGGDQRVQHQTAWWSMWAYLKINEKIKEMGGEEQGRSGRA